MSTELTWSQRFFGDSTIDNILYAPQDEVRTLQSRLLRRTLELCRDAHPYYSKLMRDRELDPTAMASHHTFVDFPITTKEDFVTAPASFRLDCDDDAYPVGVRTLWEVAHTSGTTRGTPAPFYSTGADYHASLVLAARASEVIGLGSSDVVASVWPLTPFPTGGYVRTLATCNAIGCLVFAANTGGRNEHYPVHRSLDQCVDAIVDKGATVVWGVTSFVRRILMRAEEKGADFSSVRMCLISGESSSPALRADMRQRLVDLGSTRARIVNRYGSTEGNILVECEEGSGWHNPAPDQVLLEVVDQETGAPLPDGEPGLLLITHLLRTGTVLLRYAIGDVAALDRRPCPSCGRTSERLVGVPRRVGDIVKVKGTLLSLTALAGALDDIENVQEYQLVLRHEDPSDPLSGDELVLHLAARDAFRQDVAERATERIRNRFHMTPRIQFVDHAELVGQQRGDVKARRLIDQR